MKHSTKYLFNRDRSAYEPCITVLAARRITDANILMKQLAKQQRTEEDVNKHDAIQKRYIAVEESKKWWEKIKDET